MRACVFPPCWPKGRTDLFSYILATLIFIPLHGRDQYRSHLCFIHSTTKYSSIHAPPQNNEAHKYEYPSMWSAVLGSSARAFWDFSYALELLMVLHHLLEKSIGIRMNASSYFKGRGSSYSHRFSMLLCKGQVLCANWKVISSYVFLVWQIIYSG